MKHTLSPAICSVKLNYVHHDVHFDFLPEAPLEVSLPHVVSFEIRNKARVVFAYFTIPGRGAGCLKQDHEQNNIKTKNPLGRFIKEK